MPKRGEAVCLNAREGAIGEEVEFRFKPKKPWLALSDDRNSHRAYSTCCPMTTGRARTQRALLAKNSSEDSFESDVDCQQLWTVASARTSKSQGTRVEAGTLSRVEQKLRDYLKGGESPGHRRIYQGAIAWVRMPIAWRPPNVERYEGDLQKERDNDCWRDPDLPGHWVLPTVIISSNRYLPQGTRCPPGIYHLMTVTALKRLDEAEPDNFVLMATVDSVKWRFSMDDVLMTYDWRECIGGFHRVFSYYPGIEFDPCIPDVLRRYQKKLSSHLLLSAGLP